MTNTKPAPLTLDEIFATVDLSAPIPESTPLVDGVLQRSDGPTFLYGTSGCGKTSLGAQLALQGARGDEWTVLGRNALSRPWKVLFLAGDGGTNPGLRTLQRIAGQDRRIGENLR